jgi:hypothetical protein
MSASGQKFFDKSIAGKEQEKKQVEAKYNEQALTLFINTTNGLMFRVSSKSEQGREQKDSLMKLERDVQESKLNDNEKYFLGRFLIRNNTDLTTFIGTDDELLRLPLTTAARMYINKQLGLDDKNGVIIEPSSKLSLCKVYITLPALHPLLHKESSPSPRGGGG